MDYRLLNDGQKQQIARQRLLELEAEHARLALDLRISAATGVENDNVVAGRNQLDLLAKQVETLASWITTEDQPLRGEVVPDNGRDPVVL